MISINPYPLFEVTRLRQEEILKKAENLRLANQHEESDPSILNSSSHILGSLLLFIGKRLETTGQSLVNRFSQRPL